MPEEKAKKKPIVSRHPVLKTNYLKTNLLKQIKKNIFTVITSYFSCQPHVAGRNTFLTMQSYELSSHVPNNFAIKAKEIDINQERKGYSIEEPPFLST